jgi:hypothetical protein
LIARRPKSFGHTTPLGRDLDCAVDGSIDRAAILVNGVHALDDIRRSVGRGKVVRNVNALDHEHIAVELDLADGIGGELFDFDLARCQRACKRSGQSTSGCGDDVVERGGVRLERVGRDAVVLGDGAMQAEGYRLFLAREPREADRAALSFDANLGSVDDVTHDSPPHSSRSGAHGTADWIALANVG